MQPGQLIAQAFGGIADKAEKIGQLNMSPELLQSLLAGASGEDTTMAGAERPERKVVLVTRRTRLEELVAQVPHAGAGQVLRRAPGRGLLGLREGARRLPDREADAWSHALAGRGRYQVIDRGFLPNFVFAADDIVVALGQDGLVANTMKYLDGQPLVGVNPDTARWDGVLLPFARPICRRCSDVAATGVPQGSHDGQGTLSDGQTLYAVNDLFIGRASRTPRRDTRSARRHRERAVVERHDRLDRPRIDRLVEEHRDRRLGCRERAESTANRATLEGLRGMPTTCHFAVREPFPSQHVGRWQWFSVALRQQAALKLLSLMPENGVIFSDGIEADFVEFNAGTEAGYLGRRAYRLSDRVRNGTSSRRLAGERETRSGS